MYKYFNANPLRKAGKDHTIRALCKATGESWSRIFQGLYNIAITSYYYIDDPGCYSIYLQQKGFKSYAFPRKGKMPRVKDIAAETEINNLTVIVQIKNRLIACQDGNYYDTKDNGEASVYKMWTKRKTVHSTAFL